MDPLSVTSLVVGLADTLRSYQKILGQSREAPREVAELMTEFATSAAQLDRISQIPSHLEALPTSLLEDIQRVLYQIRSVLVELEAAEGKGSGSSMMRKARWAAISREKMMKTRDELRVAVDNVMRQYTMYVNVDLTKQTINLRSLTDAAASYMQSTLGDIRNDLNSLVRLLSEKFEQPLPDFEDTRRNIGERQRDFEELRETLRRNLGAMNMTHFKLDPFYFPFVIVSAEGQPSRGGTAQVKLDSGAHDNWIGKHILERHNIDFDLSNDPRTYIGAGRGEFRALGRVTLVWFSENQALTKKTDFFVGNELPFDVILGSGYIMDDLNSDAFKAPVLPLRGLLTKEELQELEKTQRDKGAKAEDIRKIQKEQNLRAFEERRRAKRESRLGTPAYRGSSSSFLFPSSTPAGYSRRSSFVSPSITPGSITPGASQVPGRDSGPVEARRASGDTEPVPNNKSPAQG